MQIKVCPKCSEENSSSATMCTNCGVLLPAQKRIDIKPIVNKAVEESRKYFICSQCNEQIQSGSVKCPHCGAYLNRTGAYKEKTDIKDYSEPYGLKGWLVVVGIGLIISAVQLLFVLLNEFRLLTDVIELKTVSGLGKFIPMLVFELVANGLLAGFSIACLITYFKKKKIFINFFIGFYIAGLVLSIVDAMIVNGLQPHIPVINASIIQAVIKVAVWVGYIKSSKRVENTFVE